MLALAAGPIGVLVAVGILNDIDDSIGGEAVVEVDGNGNVCCLARLRGRLIAR